MGVHGRISRVSWESVVHEHNAHVVAEVAFVGKAVGSYVMLLGGGYHGQRLNKIYRGVFAPCIVLTAAENFS